MTLNELRNLYIGSASNKFGSTPELTSNGYAIKHVNSDEVTYFDTLDNQTSKYHQESLMDHIALVARNIAYITNLDLLAVKIAILHDLGKKYTIKINNIGDVCFYNHEHVSALIAKDMIDSKVFIATDEEAKIIFAVIDAHLQIKLLKGIAYECFVKGFEEIYGTRALNILLALDKADEGITKDSMIEDPDMTNYLEKIKSGYVYIDSVISYWRSYNV